MEGFALGVVGEVIGQRVDSTDAMRNECLGVRSAVGWLGDRAV